MNWTSTDSGQLLMLGMFIFTIYAIAGYAIVRGIFISNRRKKENGQ